MASLNISVHESELESVSVSATYFNSTNTDITIIADGVRIFISDYAGGKVLAKIAAEINKVAAEADLRNSIEAEVTARLASAKAEA
jgi:hypothetical protein